jgi:hypothetical protein
MADQTSRPGRLIAVDGSRGADVIAEATRVAERLRAHGVDCAISRWDASGLFGELLQADPEALVVSPRMLTLLYAADLVFRLRWEIQPALAAGRVIIAAPFVHTAVAVGVGVGLPAAWVQDVLRFAPAAAALRLTRERKRGRGWRPSPTRGYGECCAALLAAAPSGLKRRKARSRAVAWLEAAAEAGEGSSRKAIVKALRTQEQVAGSGEPAARADSHRT